MLLVEVEYMARQLFAEHNLRGWTFKFDSAKQRFGCCSYRKKTISMSRQLTELNDETQVKDTLLHEIAHAIAGPTAYHGPMWKRVAREIGCNAERCYDGETVKQPPCPWVGLCPKGHEYRRHRQPKGRHSCPQCSGNRFFSLDHLIVWKRV